MIPEQTRATESTLLTATILIASDAVPREIELACSKAIERGSILEICPACETWLCVKERQTLSLNHSFLRGLRGKRSLRGEI